MCLYSDILMLMFFISIFINFFFIICKSPDQLRSPKFLHTNFTINYRYISLYRSLTHIHFLQNLRSLTIFSVHLRVIIWFSCFFMVFPLQPLLLYARFALFLELPFIFFFISFKILMTKMTLYVDCSY